MKIQVTLLRVVILFSDVVGYQHYRVKMEAAWSTKMLASHHITTWHHNSVDRDLYLSLPQKL